MLILVEFLGGPWAGLNLLELDFRPLINPNEF